MWRQGLGEVVPELAKKEQSHVLMSTALASRDAHRVTVISAFLQVATGSAVTVGLVQGCFIRIGPRSRHRFLHDFWIRHFHKHLVNTFDFASCVPISWLGKDL